MRSLTMRQLTQPAGESVTPPRRAQARCEDPDWVAEQFLAIMTATWPDGLDGEATGEAASAQTAPTGRKPRAGVIDARRARPRRWAHRWGGRRDAAGRMHAAMDLGGRQRSPPWAR